MDSPSPSQAGGTAGGAVASQSQGQSQSGNKDQMSSKTPMVYICGGNDVDDRW